MTKEWLEYRHFKKITEKVIKHSHWTYVNDTLSDSLADGNLKPFLGYIKSNKQDSSGVAPMKHDGKLFSKGIDKANILSDQFKSVFSHEPIGPVLEPSGKRIPPIPKLKVTTFGVQKLLANIVTRKAILF